MILTVNSICNVHSAYHYRRVRNIDPAEIIEIRDVESAWVTGIVAVYLAGRQADPIIVRRTELEELIAWETSEPGADSTIVLDVLPAVPWIPTAWLRIRNAPETSRGFYLEQVWIDVKTGAQEWRQVEVI